MLQAFIWVIAVFIAAAVIIFLVKRAPFIDGEMQPFIVWFILAAAVIYALFRLLPLIPGVSG